jgi:hypothetical protein
MKRTLYKFALLAATLAAAGCATGDYAQYASIHKERAITEAARYDALANVARHSNDPTTRALAAMALGIGSAGASAKEAIAAPVNEGLEWAKLGAQTFLGGYGLRVNLGKFAIDASRGAADKDTTREALRMGDIYTNTQPAQ